MALSASDVIGPAFERMKRQIFEPFRIGQWIRLALVGFLTGEVGTAGGCSLRNPFASASAPSSGPPSLPHLPTAAGLGIVLGIALLIVTAIILSIVLLYISSRMRFVLFDSIVARECRIGEFWNKRGEQGFQYFIWQLLLLLGFGASFAVLIIAAFGFAGASGWLRTPGDHIIPLVLVGFVAFLLFLVVLVAFVFVTVVAKDFAVPQMALDKVSAVEGWRRAWAMIQADKRGFAVFLGLKILMSIGAGIVFGILTLIVFLIILLPVGGVGAIVVLWARSVGTGWNPVTIAAAVVAGIIVLTILMLVAALISVPVIVFFPTYSLLFFADRYPPLQGALQPAVSTEDFEF